MFVHLFILHRFLNDTNYIALNLRKSMDDNFVGGSCRGLYKVLSQHPLGEAEMRNKGFISE
jgi:hypothetical protein